MTIAFHAFRLLRAVLACMGMAAGLALLADDASGGFTASLSTEERAAAGLSRLAPAQVSTLDAQVARDVSLAREGDVSGFATTFLQRRSPAERVAAGVDHLSGDQKSRLDTLVARTIATPPLDGADFVYHSKAAAAVIPPESTALEVHGDISFTAGGGKGGSFYGGSTDITLSDPKGRFTITLGYANYHGKGFFADPLLLDCGPFGPFGPPVPSPLVPPFFPPPTP